MSLPKPYYSKAGATLYCGDALTVLREMESESVHCVVTSPPYWGLRTYLPDAVRIKKDAPPHVLEELESLGIVTISSTPSGTKAVNTYRKSDIPAHLLAYFEPAELGLEATPTEYVARMVQVFREVRRVLRSDGTLWLVMGDCYHGGGGGNYGDSKSTRTHAEHLTNVRNRIDLPGLKPKDLVGMPWRLAFALQADGWWLRSEIIWAKVNPMPESVQGSRWVRHQDGLVFRMGAGRPTKSHEQVFLFAKGQWKTRVVSYSNLGSEFVHFGHDLRFHSSDSGPGRFCVRFATAILDFAERENQFGLPPFYSEVWHQSNSGGDSDLISRLPVEHRSAVWAARFLRSDCSAKEFLEQVNCLTVTLSERHDLLIGWCASELSLSPSFDANGETSITVHDAGEICQFDFLHNRIVLSTPTTCKYFYDAEAIREPDKGTDHPRTVLHKPEPSGGVMPPHGGIRLANGRSGSGRNKRDVWTVATQPYAAAHFATFPPKLIEPCILAGCPEKVCAKCGAPWVCIVEKTNEEQMSMKGSTFDGGKTGARDGGNRTQKGKRYVSKVAKSKPSCVCNHPNTVPGIVLDHFAGSGTTVLVAQELGCCGIGIDLNPDYCELAKKRVRKYIQKSVPY